MHTIVSRPNSAGSHCLVHTTALTWFKENFDYDARQYRSVRQPPQSMNYGTKARDEELEFMDMAREFRRSVHIDGFPYMQVTAIQEYKGDGWAMYDVATDDAKEYIHVFQFDDLETAIKFKLTVI